MQSHLNCHSEIERLTLRFHMQIMMKSLILACNACPLQNELVLCNDFPYFLHIYGHALKLKWDRIGLRQLNPRQLLAHHHYQRQLFRWFTALLPEAHGDAHHIRLAHQLGFVGSFDGLNLLIIMSGVHVLPAIYSPGSDRYLQTVQHRLDGVVNRDLVRASEQ